MTIFQISRGSKTPVPECPGSDRSSQINFSWFGIPDIFHSDNGPQISSDALEQFAKSYNFKLTTSSPYYPKGNGLVERMVKTVRNLMKKVKDINLALLDHSALSILLYWTTPLTWCNLSPASLLMGWELRSNLHQVDSKLVPKWPYLEKFNKLDSEFRQQQMQSYNCRHRTHSQDDLLEGTQFWVETENKWVQGIVYSCAESPRSYWVDTSTGRVWRNCRHLIVIPDSTADSSDKQLSDSGCQEAGSTSQKDRHLLSSIGVLCRPDLKLILLFDFLFSSSKKKKMWWNSVAQCHQCL